MALKACLYACTTCQEGLLNANNKLFDWSFVKVTRKVCALVFFFWGGGSLNNLNRASSHMDVSFMNSPWKLGEAWESPRSFPQSTVSYPGRDLSNDWDLFQGHLSACHVYGNLESVGRGPDFALDTFRWNDLKWCFYRPYSHWNNLGLA